MVAGYHLIWVVYGYWLANDPRGSTSREIRVELLNTLGDIHYGRRIKQPSSSELRRFKEQAADLLKHPVLTFNQSDIALLGTVFGREIRATGYTCYACAIMPDHVHILIRRHRDKAEQMIAHFQQTSRQALIEARIRSVTHPVWAAGPGWKTFIDSRSGFENEIEYIRGNPEKIGWPEQKWDFVKPYDGWMPGYRG